MPDANPVLDAHVHVWRRGPRRPSWLSPSHPLRRDFTLADLRAEAGDPVPDVVLVQAEADPRETAELLDLAARDAGVRGVVGWCDLFADHADHAVGRLAQRVDPGPTGRRLLVGVRCPAPDRNDPAPLRDHRLHAGITALVRHRLVVELLVGPAALGAAAELASRHDEASFVVDHLGGPVDGGPGEAVWRSGLELLATMPNVTLKVSSLGSISGDSSVQVRYVEQAVELFGPQRLVHGSDWPLCRLHGSYRRTETLLRQVLEPSAVPAVLGGNAAAVYGIGDRAEARARTTTTIPTS